MKKKHLLVMGITCVVLGAVLLVTKYTERTPTLQEQLELVKLAPAGFGLKELGRIDIYRKDEKGKRIDEVVLVRKDEEKWSVKSRYGAPAEMGKIRSFVGKVADMMGERRVGGTLERYGLKGKDVLFVDFFGKDGKKRLLALEVGKKSNTGGCFVRVDGGKDVFRVGVDLAEEMGIWEEENRKSESSHWLDLTIARVDKEKVRRIVLKTPDRRLVLEKKSSGKGKGEKEEKKEKAAAWCVVEGMKLQVKKKGVEDLLDALSRITATDVEDPAEKKKLGLDEPPFRCVVTYGKKGKEKTLVLLASRTDPTSDGYIVVEGREGVVYKVSSYTFDNVFPEASDLLKIPGLKVEDGDVRQLTLGYEKGEVVFKRDEDTWEWRLASPRLGLEFKESTLNRVIQEVTDWKPADYAEVPLEKAGVEKTKRTVTIVMKDGKKYVFKIGVKSKAFDGRYVLGGKRQELWVMKGSDVDDMYPQLRDLFDLDALNVKTKEILSLAVKRDALDYTVLRRGKEKWIIRCGGKEVVADKDLTERVLDRFSPFRITDVLLGERFDTKNAWGSAALMLKKNRRFTVTFSRPDKEGDCRVVISGKEGVFKIGKYTAENITPPLKDFFSLTVLDVDRDEVERIVVRRGDEVLSVRRKEGKWVVSAGGKEVKEVDRKKRRRWLDDLTYLRAEDVYIGDLPQGSDSYGTVTVEKKDGGKEAVTVYLMKDGRFLAAKKGERKGILFVLKKGTVEKVFVSASSLRKAKEKKKSSGVGKEAARAKKKGSGESSGKKNNEEKGKKVQSSGGKKGKGAWVKETG